MYFRFSYVVVLFNIDDASVEEVREFHKEISLMKTVGKHKNIVSLIGCCTQSTRLLLVVEFCALGDLQNYLRQVSTQRILNVFS